VACGTSSQEARHTDAEEGRRSQELPAGSGILNAGVSMSELIEGDFGIGDVVRLKDGG